jgi:hypothetical protein
VETSHDVSGSDWSDISGSRPDENSEKSEPYYVEYIKALNI